jgi:hypothetical protein
MFDFSLSSFMAMVDSGLCPYPLRLPPNVWFLSLSSFMVMVHSGLYPSPWLAVLSGLFHCGADSPCGGGGSR